MFIGNFKNGFMLLVLLFFYDIFFVFGTDVMLTVAKGIDAPIKLLFPKDYSEEKPKYSLLGLGDIVIPGIFVSLCLRFDFLKHLNINYFEKLIR
jgi:minor histocompatibility antigen H13